MSTTLLSLGLDIIILICLIATIFYALKLSKSLNAFRSHRKDFEKLLKDVNIQIGHAQTAIRDLEQSSRDTAQDMDDLIRTARSLSSELQIINEASESLAQRLEGAATSARQRSTPESSFENEEEDMAYQSEELSNNIEKLEDRLRHIRKEEKPIPSFFIQDRELDDGYDDDFRSDAERDLYEAMKGRKT